MGKTEQKYSNENRHKSKRKLKRVRFTRVLVIRSYTNRSVVTRIELQSRVNIFFN